MQCNIFAYIASYSFESYQMSMAKRINTHTWQAIVCAYDPYPGAANCGIGDPQPMWESKRYHGREGLYTVSRCQMQDDFDQSSQNSDLEHPGSERQSPSYHNNEQNASKIREPMIPLVQDQRPPNRQSVWQEVFRSENIDVCHDQNRLSGCDPLTLYVHVIHAIFMCFVRFPEWIKATWFD